jgi:hypothetical protein
MLNYLSEPEIKEQGTQFHEIGFGANQMYKAIFENSPEAIVVLERNGDVANVNNRVFDWLGFKPEEIIGKNFRNLSLLTYKSKLKVAINLIRRLNGENIPPYELIFIDVHGDKRIGRVSVSSIKNKSGKITRIMVIISDITKNRKIEEDLQDYQDQLKAVFSISSDMLILMDQNFTYKAVNPAFCDYMNLHESEVIGKTDFDIYPKEEAELYRQTDMAVLESGKTWEEDIQVMGKDGKLKWFYVIKSAIIAPNGNTTGILLTIRDITKRKLIENQLKRQKEFLDKIFESSSSGMILINGDKEIVRSNTKALEILQKEGRELGGMVCNAFDCPLRDKGCPTINFGEKVVSTECQIFNKKGEKIYILKSVAKIEDENEIFYLESFIDITERKRTEKKVKKLVNTLLQERGIFSKGPVVVFKWKNAKGWPVENVSSNLHEVLGYSTNDLISGKVSYQEIIYEEDLERVAEEVDNYCKTGITNFTHEPYRLIRKDGEVIWVSDSTSIVRDKSGNITHFYGYVFDITAHKIAEDELLESKRSLEKQILDRTHELEKTNAKLLSAKNKAEESDKLKSAFLANMSHEIRTPMNIILGFGELLTDENSMELQKEYIQNINKSGKHLLELINDIIDVSKLEAGLVNINNSKFIIEEELEDLYKQFTVHEKCLKGHVRLVLDINLDGSQNVIYTDPLLFKQVLINLLNNALKFTQKGQVNFGFHLKNIEGLNFYEFYVRDTGIGLSSSNKEVIFDRFRQVNYKDKRTYGGTGLGLSICKANVRLLGGNMNLDSNEGKGSVFTFTIPADESRVLELQTNALFPSDVK